MNINEFKKQVELLGVDLSEDQLNKLEKYYELLIEWNQKINLTSITSKEEVYLKHFYDSLTLVRVINLNKELNVLDVGTGAGFPGIVLKICFPSLKITLLDSLLKRINFLDIVISELNLKNIKTVHDRAEDYAHSHFEEYDLVVSRAVAKLSILSELCIPMVKINGYFVSLKGHIDEELKEAKSAIKMLNSEIEEIKSFELPLENSVRNIVKIKKNNKTNSKYPRKFDKIKKNPL